MQYNMKSNKNNENSYSFSYNTRLNHNCLFTTIIVYVQDSSGVYTPTLLEVNFTSQKTLFGKVLA